MRFSCLLIFHNLFIWLIPRIIFCCCVMSVLQILLSYRCNSIQFNFSLIHKTGFPCFWFTDVEKSIYVCSPLVLWIRGRTKQMFFVCVFCLVPNSLVKILPEILLSKCLIASSIIEMIKTCNRSLFSSVFNDSWWQPTRFILGRDISFLL